MDAAAAKRVFLSRVHIAQTELAGNELTWI